MYRKIPSPLGARYLAIYRPAGSAAHPSDPAALNLFAGRSVIEVRPKATTRSGGAAAPGNIEAGV